MIAITAHDPGFIEDAAHYATGTRGGTTLEQLAAKHGGLDAVLNRLSDPEAARAIDARAVAMAQDGTTAKAAAHALLLAALDNLEKAIADGELSAATVVRIADLAHRVSGMAQPAREQTVQDRPTFSVIIQGAPNMKPVIDVASREVGHE